MSTQVTISALERKRRGLLKRVAGLLPFLGGSLVLVGRVCGYHNCACAKGKKHPTYYVTWKEKKKTRTLYIPKDMLKEVKEWVREYERLREIIKKMNEVQRHILRRYVTEKRYKTKKRM